VKFIEHTDLPTCWAACRGPDGWTVAVRPDLNVEDLLCLLAWLDPPELLPISEEHRMTIPARKERRAGIWAKLDERKAWLEGQGVSAPGV
jgi:hypothetical protein